MSLDRTETPKEKKRGGHLEQKNTPLRTALTYLVFGVLWIVLTDKLVAINLPNLGGLPAQTIKGFLFVAASALLIYIVSTNDLKETQASQARYRALFEQSHDAIFIIDLQGKYLDANQRAEDMTGYSLKELKGLSPTDLSTEPEQSQGVIERLRRGESIPLYERQFRRKNGEMFLAELNVELVRDAYGRPLHIQSVVRDITKRKAVEEQVAWLARFPSENPNPVMRASSKGLLIYANPASTPLLAEWHCQVHEYLPQEWVERIEAAASSGKLVRGDTECAGRSFMMTITPLPGRDYVNLYATDITERKQAEEKLAYQAFLLENINDAILATDEQRNITSWNHAAEKLFGWTAQEALGHSVSEIVRTEFSEEQRGQAMRALEEGRQYKTEVRVTHRDGEKIWVEGISSALRKPDGTINGYISINRDITERKQAEEYLREAHQFNQATIDALSAHLCVLDQDGFIISINRSWKEFAEANPPVPANHFLGVNYLEVCEQATGPYAEEAAPFAAGLHAILNGQQSAFSLEYPCHDPRGEKRWFYAHVTRFAVQGRVQIVISHENITERKQAEEALRESAERYKLLFENNPHPMWVYDLESLAFLMVNDAAVDHYGYSREEFLGMTLKDIRPAEEVPNLLENIAQQNDILQKSQGWKHRLKDGRLIDVEISSHGLQFENRPARLVIANDITERRRMENEIIATRDRLTNVLDSISDAFIALDRDWRITYANQEAGRINKKRPEEFIGKIHWEEWPAAVGSPFETNLRKAMTERVALHFEERYFVEGQYDTWLDVHVYPNEDGLTLYYHDISERRQAETALKVSEENYRSLAETSDSAIAVLDRNGSILYANPTSQRIWDDPQLVGKTVYDLFPGELASRYLADMQRVIDEQAIDLNKLEVSINGHAMWFRVSMRPLKNLDGSVNSLILTAWDLTDLKQAEDKLRANAATLTQAGKLAHLGAWALEINDGDDFMNYPLSWSDEVYFIFGYQPGQVQVTTRFFFEHIHPDERQRVREAVERALTEKQTIQIEHRILHAAGIERVVLEYGEFLLDDEGRPVRIMGAVQDITERKWAMDTLRESEERFRTLFEGSPIAIWEEDFSQVWRYLNSLREAGVTDFEAYFDAHPDVVFECARLIAVLNTNRAALQMYESASKGELIENTSQTMSEGEMEHFREDLLAITEGRLANSWEGLDETMTGRSIEISMSWSVVPSHEQDYSRVIVTTVDITDHRQAVRALQQNQQILHEAQAMARLGSWTVDLKDMTFTISPENSELLGVPAGLHKLSGLIHLVHPSDLEFATAALNEAIQNGTPVDVQFRIVIGGETRWLHVKARVTKDKEGKPISALGVTQDITERMLASEQLRASEARFRQLAENLEEVFWVSDPQTHRELYISPAAERIWGRSLEELYQTTHAFLESVLPEDKPMVMAALEKQAEGERTDIEYRILKPDGSLRWVWDRAFPIQGEEADGAKLVAGLAADITERKDAEVRIQQQVQRLSALNSIDNVISASMDIGLTLNVFLTEVLLQLKVDAADVHLLNPFMQTLEFAAGQGFHSNAIQNSKIELGDTTFGRSVLERRMAHIPDLSALEGRFMRLQYLGSENFIAYYSLPLVAKGQLKGVLEIFHRQPLNPDPEWLDYLNTLAAQAAIAIDNAQLFEEMQQSNLELSMAYDATITGWSRAMDLRDKETEGHTQRVTQLTLRLAGRMDIPKQDLIHIRRGALLHDIGKLGVPDQILLKPDKLTDEEWEHMRRHPTYAYEMLNTINYLKPALDIPYCHHEKWDGSGYPQGMKGEQIPLAARIFAIVDVWDALHSDRPYRPGWPKQKIRELIVEQSGKHFDPRVVEAFLRMLDESPDL